MGIDNIWHVFPVGDTHEHVTEADWRTLNNGTIGEDGNAYHDVRQVLICECPCIPIVKEEGDGYMIIHNSFDGREGVEWANEILNAE